MGTRKKSNLSAVSTEPSPEFLAHLRSMSTQELLAFTATLSTRDWRQMTELDIAEIGRFVQTDGCTGTFDFYLQCCILHDWVYRTHRDFHGQPMSKKDADKLLRSCIMSRSWLGQLNPMAWWRYWAVRRFGRKAWR